MRIIWIPPAIYVFFSCICFFTVFHFSRFLDDDIAAQRNGFGPDPSPVIIIKHSNGRGVGLFCNGLVFFTTLLQQLSTTRCVSPRRAWAVAFRDYQSPRWSETELGSSGLYRMTLDWVALEEENKRNLLCPHFRFA